MKQELTAEVERLRKSNSGFKWTQPENLHFTLKFLGEIEPVRLAGLEQDLSTVAIGVNSFQLQLGQAGFFPPKGELRIIWIGLNAGANALKRLAEQVEEACHLSGFPRESKPFQPHLTIARARDGAHPKAPSDFSPQFSSVTNVTGFSLIESRLYSTGPVYHTITDFPLK
jgi:2'-5' RNA ligase